jgi:hexokinase
MADGTTFPPLVKQVLDSLVIPRERLVKISEDIEAEFKIGLKHGSQGSSSIAMLPSYVPALPTGKESGKYVAIDLSGKNLRILLLTLYGGEKEPDVSVNNYIVSNAIMKGTGEQLFNFIVNCLQKFLKEFSLEEANLPIGFVFSYPLNCCQLDRPNYYGGRRASTLLTVCNKTLFNFFKKLSS